MATDMYGRTLCKRGNCAAYMCYYGEKVCNALLMYESKKYILCRLPDQYKITLDKNYEKQ